MATGSDSLFQKRKANGIFIALFVVLAGFIFYMFYSENTLKKNYEWHRSDVSMTISQSSAQNLNLKIHESDILNLLKEVMDPELNINIVDLGLIRKLEIKENNVFIIMTLTIPTCPFGPEIIKKVKNKLFSDNRVFEVSLSLVFNPPWSWDMVKPDIKEKIFIQLNMNK